jgi:asparagine synthase (glutamine-hydrolysing)
LAVRGLFPPAVAARILDAGRLPLPDGLPPIGRLTRGNYALLEADHYLHDQLLRDTDVFSMCHSLEVRVPFLDHRLAELAFALPEKTLRIGAGEKPLMAAALSPEYPPGLLGRAKMGFSLPFTPWLKEKLPNVVGEYLRRAAVSDVEREELRKRFRAGSLHWSRLWALVVLGGLQGSSILPVGRPPAR